MVGPIGGVTQPPSVMAVSVIRTIALLRMGYSLLVRTIVALVIVIWSILIGAIVVIVIAARIVGAWTISIGRWRNRNPRAITLLDIRIISLRIVAPIPIIVRLIAVIPVVIVVADIAWIGIDRGIVEEPEIIRYKPPTVTAMMAPMMPIAMLPVFAFLRREMSKVVTVEAMELMRGHSTGLFLSALYAARRPLEITCGPVAKIARRRATEVAGSRAVEVALEVA